MASQPTSSSANGDGGPAASAAVCYPLGVSIGRANTLFIDTSAGRIRIVTASGIPPTTPTAAPAFTVAPGNQCQAGPTNRTGARQLLYISTPNVGRVRKVTADTGVITTVAGNGNPFGNSGDGGSATSAEVDATGLAFDSTGDLYISDGDTAIRRASASTGGITRVVGNGYPGSSGDGGSATVAGISYPQGIAFDATGNLYIADSGNYRVRKVTSSAPEAITFGALANQTYGAAPLTLGATASSGLAVSFSSTTPTICTVAGTTATLVRAGTCTIEATQAGNAEYAAATPVTQNFTVSKAVVTITANNATVLWRSQSGLQLQTERLRQRRHFQRGPRRREADHHRDCGLGGGHLSH